MNDPIFRGWRVPPEFKSDGCTFSPDRFFGKDLKPACKLHDFLRRHAIVPVKEADRIFHAYLIELGAPRWLARLYWFAVKITRNWFRRTQPLPDKWDEYREPLLEAN